MRQSLIALRPAKKRPGSAQIPRRRRGRCARRLSPRACAGHTLERGPFLKNREIEKEEENKEKRKRVEAIREWWVFTSKNLGHIKTSKRTRREAN